MTDKSSLPSDPNNGAVFMTETIKRLQLIWLLFKDSRVSFLAKSVLPLSLLYLISPVDFLPGAVFPVVGGLDDVGVILLGMALFLKLSPQDVVQYYQDRLEYGDLYDSEAIDTTYRVVDED
jgi:uncharacterized membrane protein YkvA (DUF1232 family)